MQSGAQVTPYEEFYPFNFSLDDDNPESPFTIMFTQQLFLNPRNLPSIPV